MTWMEDMKRLQRTPKLSSVEINNFILHHPEWAASIIRNALEMEMYIDFCLSCENFERCYEKLGSVKMETQLRCICNEFLNKKHSEANKRQLRAYFEEVTVMLGF